MPQRRSGIKELRKNKRNKLHNLDIKTDLKKTIKSFKALAVSENQSEAESKLKEVYKKIDKAEKRNLIHKNTAARRKSQLTKQLTAKKA